MGAAIVKIRTAIRCHRDQKGDERCWLDDYLVWKFIGTVSEEMPSYEEGMKKC
ncbi:MAG TPA: hypothetical protein VJH68_00055 [Candidatus Nanoarchaeia archaeon]|nr:hypothetical protein [Candidatus Nanoarchaeia archaeon]